jgi:phosphoribosyl 1,2-cyclic phosphodiesterase
MKITVWGSRGSICSPGPKTIRYGGNTTCLELRTSTGRLVVVDAGSGLRYLGKQLMKEPGVKDIIFVLTHSHWDHLIGFPFFTPAYKPEYNISLCGGPAARDSIRKYLGHQMSAPYFPVDFSIMKARFTYGCACPSDRCEGKLEGFLDFNECSSLPLNHPNGGYGFKFVDQGKTFVFLTDNELRFQHEGGLAREQYVDFCRGADLLFHDAQYTEAEYAHTQGWGHSTYLDAIELAVEARVKRLGLFHHDPDRSDDDLDHQVDFCRDRLSLAGREVDCFAVADGMELEV